MTLESYQAATPIVKKIKEAKELLIKLEQREVIVCINANTDKVLTILAEKDSEHSFKNEALLFKNMIIQKIKNDISQDEAELNTII